jgi:hypothetical protein
MALGGVSAVPSAAWLRCSCSAPIEQALVVFWDKTGDRSLAGTLVDEAMQQTGLPERCVKRALVVFYTTAFGTTYLAGDILSPMPTVPTSTTVISCNRDGALNEAKDNQTALQELVNHMLA